MWFRRKKKKKPGRKASAKISDAVFDVFSDKMKQLSASIESAKAR